MSFSRTAIPLLMSSSVRKGIINRCIRNSENLSNHQKSNACAVANNVVSRRNGGTSQCIASFEGMNSRRAFSSSSTNNNSNSSNNIITKSRNEANIKKLSSSSYATKRQSSSTSTSNHIEQRRHLILSHALQRVHDEGWTDDAIASATLDAGLPPSYIGQASSSTSLFGSADLVQFFMEECNNNLRRQLAEEDGNATTTPKTATTTASRVYKALHMRLSMVTPFVASQRWHEGMAIGALPQNAYRTAQQLNDMAQIVYDYAMEGNDTTPSALPQRAAIIAAYASAELHLLSDGSHGTLSGNSVSLSGERYSSTWSFLKERSEEAARLMDQSNYSSYVPILNGVPLPNPYHVVAASAVASSFAGAALSMAAPTAASLAGYALPRAMEALGPLQNFIVGVGGNIGGGGGGGGKLNRGRDGTMPSDYQVEDLPPFDSSEVIFPESGKSA